MQPRNTASYARPAAAPVRAVRREIVRLRGLLVLALGALLFHNAAPALAPAATALIAALGLSTLLLARAPLGWFERRRFDVGLAGVDIVLVATGLGLAGLLADALPASCLLMVLVVALADEPRHVVSGATVIGAFHAWLALRAGAAGPNVSGLALEILFLCAVALYFGDLARRTHRRRRRSSEMERLDSEELRVLVRVLEAISSSLDLHQAALTIVSQIATLIPTVRCSMLFVDPEGRRCYVLASHDEPSLDRLELDLGKYPEVRRAVETGNSVLVQNAPDDPILAEVRAQLEHLNFRSILVVPLTFRGKVLGTLCLKTAHARTEFTADEMRFCTAVARASANALQNALLHDRVREEAASHRTTSEKLTRILEDSPDLILTTDAAGRVSEINRGAERVLGVTRAEALGQPCQQLFGPDCGPALLERVRLAGNISNHGCQLRRRDGAEVQLEINLSVLRADDEGVAGAVWVGRDVSELKATQLQLLQAKKLSTIGEVISGVAHELNNPLSGVLGYAQLLASRHASSPLSRDLGRILESAQRCQKIVQSLLAFARGHKPERRHLGLNGILEKTIELRRYQLEVNDIEIVRELDPELPRTLLDYHQMQQVFLNLLNNAEQAIVAARRRPGRLLVRTSQGGGSIRVEFEDNGVGMDPETQERIFDPFFTTKPPGQGTGLGLSVSYGIVHEHEGRIWARSRPGVGSTFVIELPIRGPASAAAAAGDEPSLSSWTAPAPTSARATILVVDDEPLVLDLMVDALGERGYQVDTAADGREACRKLAGRSYDLVLTDVRMPQMDGIELYARIRDLHPELAGRVLFMTGDLISKETSRFLEQSRVRSIAKPLDVERLASLIGDALNGSGGTSPLVARSRSTD